jgi:hypothetical protein
MGGLFLAAPAQVPAVEGPVWVSCQHTWTDYTGTVWDISGRTSGVYLRAGVRGMNMPPVTRYTSKSPAVAGSRWRGSITDERDVFWPLHLFQKNGSQEWIDHDARFWDTLNPDRTGVWSVVQPNGVTRTLTLRFVDDGGQSFDTSPELFGWCSYGVNLIAEQPYWIGEKVSRTWGQTDTPDGFFGPSGYGPPFYITSASTMGNATIDNPGDVSAWPVWTLAAPFTSATVGVGSKTVQVPFSMSEGWLRIDTNPTAQTAVDHLGVDRTAQLGQVKWAEIPAGKGASVTVNMVGQGNVTLELSPRYYRAR